MKIKEKELDWLKVLGFKLREHIKPDDLNFLPVTKEFREYIEEWIQTDYPKIEKDPYDCFGIYFVEEDLNCERCKIRRECQRALAGFIDKEVRKLKKEIFKKGKKEKPGPKSRFFEKSLIIKKKLRIEPINRIFPIQILDFPKLYLVKIKEDKVTVLTRGKDAEELLSKKRISFIKRSNKFLVFESDWKSLRDKILPGLKEIKRKFSKRIE